MSNEIVKRQQSAVNLFNPETFEQTKQMAKVFVHSDLVPDKYRVGGKVSESKATANVIIAMDIANRIGANPLAVMQNMVPIHGKPTWSSTFLIATVNTCGRFQPLQYEYKNLGKLGKIKYTDYVWDDSAQKKKAVSKEFDGSNIDNLQCIAYTTPNNSNQRLDSTPITVQMAVEEGWYVKSGSKWPNMTKQMLMYRAASFWTKGYAPELSFGMQTTDEVKDYIDIPHEDVSNTVKNTVKEKGNSQQIDPNQVSEGNENKKDEDSQPQANKAPLEIPSPPQENEMPPQPKSKGSSFPPIPTKPKQDNTEKTTNGPGF